MGKTVRREATRKPEDKEAADVRRELARRNRHITNLALRRGQWDADPVVRGPHKTQGYHTW